MASLKDRILRAIFDRREDEDDDTPVQEENDIGIEDLNRTIGVKSKHGVFSKGYGGFLNDDPNPLLTGKAAITAFDKMRTVDVQVMATLLSAELPIRSTEWKVNPGQTKKSDGTMETTPKDQEIADFVSYNLFTNCRTSWDDYIRLSLGKMWAGFAIFEKVYEEKNGKIMLKKLSDRPQTTIEKFYDMDGNLMISQTGNVTIPGWKVLIHTYRREGDNFAGRSAIRPAYQNWKYKTDFYRLDAIAHERNALKVPVMNTPTNPKDEEKMAAKEIVKNLKTSDKAHVVLPGSEADGWKFRFEGTGSDNEGIMKSISHHNREISKAILAQFIELGAEGKGGSYALSEDQSDLFILGLHSIAKEICRVTNEFLVRELVDMNFEMTEGQTYPEIGFDKLGSVNYEKIVNALEKLAGKKIITPDNSIEDKVREMFDLPPAVYGEDGKVENGRVIETPKVDLASLTNPPAQDTPGKKEKKKFSESPREFTGCVMASIKAEDVPAINIASEDLALDEDGTGGLEKYPHVTLLYGIRTDITKEDIMKRISFDMEKVTILSMDVFEQDEQDVLIFKINPSRYLESTNQSLKMLPHENNYPNFLPHMTIGYIKKGTAGKYLTDAHNGKEMQITDIVYTLDENANAQKVFSEDDAEHKIFTELRQYFDPIDMSRLSSLIK